MTSISNKPATVIWTCSKFEDLSSEELYAILRLRAEVFIVEQNCAYQDLDLKDHSALHLLGYIDDKLGCYARLLPPGVSYEDASLGRIVTGMDNRSSGLGRQLIQESLSQCEKIWPGAAITISAQHYLENFYSEYGFKSESEAYMEDGIPHIKMRRPCASKS